MIFSDEVLMAYADGELDIRTREQVADAIAKDPEIARRVAAHEALRDALRSKFDPVLDEPVPDRLITAAHAVSRAPSGDRVVPLRRKSAATGRSWPRWAAMAASVVVGALLLQFGTSLHTSGSITERDGQLLASGALEQALSNQLTNNQAQAPVQIGASYRSKSGNYCRTFQLRETSALAGLACREENGWRVEILARGDASPSSNPQYRPAASALPSSVIQAVNETIAGEPLDADAERVARERQWRGPQ